MFHSFLGTLIAVVLNGHSHSAEPPHPISIAVTDSQKIFLADRRLPGVWLWTDRQVKIFYRAQRQFNTPLNAVRCVALDRSGRLLVGDSATREIYRFDEQGKPHPLTQGKRSPGDEGFVLGRIGMPMDIAVNSSGVLYVSDLEIGRVLKIPASGGEPEVVARIAGCRGLFVDGNDCLWVVSTTANQLYRIPPDGPPEIVVHGRPFKLPHTVAVDPAGVAYVCDSYAKAIWRIVAKDPPQLWCQDPALVQPTGIDIAQGTLYVADPGAKTIFEIDSSGRLKRLDSVIQPPDTNGIPTPR